MHIVQKLLCKFLCCRAKGEREGSRLVARVSIREPQAALQEKDQPGGKKERTEGEERNFEEAILFPRPFLPDFIMQLWTIIKSLNVASEPFFGGVCSVSLLQARNGWWVELVVTEGPRSSLHYGS